MFVAIPVRTVLLSLMTDEEFRGVLAVMKLLRVTTAKAFWRRRRRGRGAVFPPLPGLERGQLLALSTICSQGFAGFGEPKAGVSTGW